MSTYYFLDNLSSHKATKAEGGPWTAPGYDAPDHVKGPDGKKARTKWILDPKTKACVYSGVEGVNPNARVACESEKPTYNPPHKCSMFFPDYDTNVSDEAIAEGITKLTYAPNAIERTLSGYVRLGFTHELNLRIEQPELHAAFYKILGDELGLKNVAGGLDQKALLDCTRYYTNSCKWAIVDLGSRIPSSLAQGCLVKATQKIDWLDAFDGDILPLEIVAQELAKKYPGFTSWPGEFVLNAQGPTFWIPASKSPMSAIVKENGIYTFSENAEKAFWSWEDLLGREFVSKFVHEQLSVLVTDNAYDGEHYYTISPPKSKTWVKETKTDTEDRLRLERKLSARKDKASQSSQIDRAMQYIRSYKRIAACAPFLYLPPGPGELEGVPIINTCMTRPIQPAAEVGIFGPDGQFPFHSAYHAGFMEAGVQFDTLHAWIKHFYGNALNFRQSAGQVMIIAGPPGVGKTYFSNVFLSRLMGGSVPVEEMIFDGAAFNGAMMNRGVWCIDDCTRIFRSVSSAREKEKFTATIKNVASVGNYLFNEKYHKAVSVTCLPRLLITTNDDVESIQILPALDQNNGDKVTMLRTRGAEHHVKFLATHEENRAVLEKELPYYASWLLAQDFPLAEKDTRFGVKSYHHPDLVAMSEQNSPESELISLLHVWIKERAENAKIPVGEIIWTGTVTLMLRELEMDCTMQARLRYHSPKGLSVMLVKLAGRNAPGIEFKDKRDKTREWRLRYTQEIACPTDENKVD